MDCFYPTNYKVQLNQITHFQVSVLAKSSKWIKTLGKHAFNLV